MKVKKILKFVIAIVVIILILGVGVWHYFQSKLERLVWDPVEPTSKVTSTINNETATHNRNDMVTSNEQSEELETLLPEQEVGVFDSDVLNVLLIGTDERKNEFSTYARADSMMIVSVNLKEHTAKLVSLERGIGVPVEGIGEDWLTHVFTYGGAELLMDTVNQCFNLDITRYVRVNFHTFEKIIDCIGGVDIELTEAEVKALNNEAYTNAVTKNKVVVGLNHLNGYDALQYCRQRFVDDDWHRIKRQRNTIQAAVKQTKDLSIFEINDMLNEVLPLVKTNFTKKEISALLFSAPFFIGVDIEQLTVPVPGSYTSETNLEGKSLFKVDFDYNAQILKDFFYK